MNKHKGPKRTDGKLFALFVQTDLREAMEKAALADSRSLTNWMTHVLRSWLQQHHYLPGGPE